MDPIRLLLVDDHPVVREGIKMLFASQEGIEVVGEAANGEEALTRAIELKPDVVLMDISMPLMNGIEATTVLRQEAPDSKILILTMHDDKEYVLQITRSGANGYGSSGTLPPAGESSGRAFSTTPFFFSASTCSSPMSRSFRRWRISSTPRRRSCGHSTPTLRCR